MSKTATCEMFFSEIFEFSQASIHSKANGLCKGAKEEYFWMIDFTWGLMRVGWENSDPPWTTRCPMAN